MHGHGTCLSSRKAKGERDEVLFLSSLVCEEIGLSLRVFVRTDAGACLDMAPGNQSFFPV